MSHRHGLLRQACITCIQTNQLLSVLGLSFLTGYAPLSSAQHAQCWQRQQATAGPELLELQAWCGMLGCVAALESMMRDKCQPTGPQLYKSMSVSISHFCLPALLADQAALPACVSLAATVRKLMHTHLHRSALTPDQLYSKADEDHCLMDIMMQFMGSVAKVVHSVNEAVAANSSEGAGGDSMPHTGSSSEGDSGSSSCSSTAAVVLRHSRRKRRMGVNSRVRRLGAQTAHLETVRLPLTHCSSSSQASC